MVASGSVALRGVDIAGPGGAPAIVFVHASGWSRKLWVPQMNALSTTYRVVALDLPQHGDRRDVPFSMQTALDAVNDAVRVSGSSRVLLVGLSLGGYIAIAYAHAHPERLAGVAVGGCSVSFMGWLGTLTRISARVHLALLWLFGRHLRARLLARQERAIHKMYPPPLADALLAGGIEPAVWGRALLAVVPYDYDRWLAELPCPILILNGELDDYNRRAQERQAVELPQVEVHTIIGAGHVCNLACPDAFTDEVRAFAERLPWQDEAGPNS